MTSYRIPASTALPPAFTGRERAALDAYFGTAGRAAQPAGDGKSLIIAAAAVALAIGLIFGIHGTAHADRITASAAVVASLDGGAR